MALAENILGEKRRMLIPNWGYKHSVMDGVRQTAKEGADLCDLIWGYIPEGEEEGLKGRVVVSHAFQTDKEKPIRDKDLVLVKGVLGEPRASFYPYYLAKQGDDYGSYDDDNFKLAGRKRYRIHARATTTTLPQGNGSDKVSTTFRALPAGQEFSFRITVHNLRPAELGAVLSALTFHRQKGVWHNLGMAKAHGFGKIELLDVQLQGFAHDERTYLEVFEEKMTLFTREQMKQSWLSTPQMRQLLSIATEHEDSDVEVMSLDDYKKVKTSKKRVFLSKGNFTGQTLVNESSLIWRKVIRDNSTLIASLRQYIEQREWKNATEAYDELQSKCLGCSISELSAYKEAIDAGLEVQRKEEEKKKQEELEAQKAKEAEDRKERLLSGGLKGLLDETSANGKYKVTTLKVLTSKLEAYVKALESKELKQEDVDALFSTLDRLNASRDKKEKNVWNNPASQYWMKIADYLPEPALLKEWLDKHP